jgi:hypothetical protein
VPDKPEPFSLLTVSFKEGVATSTNLELTIVWFEPVSKIKTAGFPLTSAVTSIKPKTRLTRNGISAGVDGCGKTRNPMVTAKTRATVYRQAVFKATDFLTAGLSVNPSSGSAVTV